MKRVCIIVIIILVMLKSSNNLWASPTTAYDAEMVVTGWLKANPKPLGSDIGGQIISVETVTDDLDEPVYYVVNLQPSGFVIVSADDLVEPIIAFSGSGTYEPAPASPLKSLVTEDLKARNAAVRKSFVPMAVTPQVVVSETQKKWNCLIGLAGMSNSGFEPMDATPVYDNNLSDLRVPPLVQSKWGQSNYYDSNDQPRACYNYCTPMLLNGRITFIEGQVDNFPVGCVAVTLAQFLRSQEYPQEPVEPKQFTIVVEDKETDRALLGGDGPGGAYNWDDMVPVPDDDTTEQQRRAIGALCHDAAIAVDTTFGAEGSGASLDNVVNAFLETFQYQNAVWAENEGGLLDRRNFISLINPNLDAGIPVIIGFRYSTYKWIGHAALCDGYGYNLSTLYHHLNMGWEGEYDCWYALPDIAYPDAFDFDVITQCAYNIFADCTGEIISGRIIDSNGVPFEGVTVTAQSETDVVVRSVMTNDNGIYAFKGLDSNTAYTITPDMPGYDFDFNLGYDAEENIVTTGWSGGDSFIAGNVWGVDLIGYQNSDSNSAGRGSQVVCADTKLIASDGARNDHFGCSVSISGDYAVVGAYGDDDNRGAAYIFKREGARWTEQAKLRKSIPRQMDDYFGFSVSISGDRAIVGAGSTHSGERNNSIGDFSAYIFERNGTSWALQCELITTDVDLNSRFGSSVSISGDYAVVGAPQYARRGSALIFKSDDTTWIQQDMLFDSNFPDQSYIGDLVSINEDYVILSGGYHDRSRDDYGPIYIFKRDDTTWTEQAMFRSLDNFGSDKFGCSVSISSNYAVVGARDDDTENESDVGCVYVFKREGTNWAQQTRLTALDSESWAHFGSSVAISGDFVIVGSPDDDDHYNGKDSGSAYIFESHGEGWTQRSKLTSMDAAYDDFFGTSVAVDGDYAIVGAPGDDDNGRESGSVYIFKRIGSVWTP